MDPISLLVWLKSYMIIFCLTSFWILAIITHLILNHKLKCYLNILIHFILFEYRKPFFNFTQNCHDFILKEEIIWDPELNFRWDLLLLFGNREFINIFLKGLWKRTMEITHKILGNVQTQYDFQPDNHILSKWISLSFFFHLAPRIAIDMMCIHEPKLFTQLGTDAVDTCSYKAFWHSIS